VPASYGLFRNPARQLPSGSEAGFFVPKRGSFIVIEDKPEIVWGAQAIGRVIGRSEKSTFAALEQGKIPGAKKIAGRWGFNPRVFFATFETAA
jgi:hypothetical protein